MTRRILHCDLDCFYAAVHMRDDPALAGRPVVVGGSPEGRGVVAAASYEARRYGIHSAMPAARAVSLCPNAVFIKPDFQRYRKESSAIFALYREITPLVQTLSLDEAYLDVTDHLDPWGSATEIAREIRSRVKQKTALTVSVGVGPNRLVAKIASDFDKPDGLTVVPPQKVLGFLAPLPVRRLPGVGPATEKRLHKLGIKLVRELREMPLQRLERRFGRHGKVLHDYAHGKDERPVRTEREPKSVSAERTYPRDLATLDEIRSELQRLAERVAQRLEKSSLAGSTVTLKVRYSDFRTLTRSKSLDHPVAQVHELLPVALELLRLTEAPERSVRLLGLGVSHLGAPASSSQLDLFSPPQPDTDS